jgi:hypothetical protein
MSQALAGGTARAGPSVMVRPTNTRQTVEMMNLVIGLDPAPGRLVVAHQPGIIPRSALMIASPSLTTPCVGVAALRVRRAHARAM